MEFNLEIIPLIIIAISLVYLSSMYYFDRIIRFKGFLNSNEILKKVQSSIIKNFETLRLTIQTLEFPKEDL